MWNILNVWIANDELTGQISILSLQFKVERSAHNIPNIFHLKIESLNKNVKLGKHLHIIQ